MEVLYKWLRGRIAALRGARNLAVLLVLSRLLRSVRLALHPARPLLQGSLKIRRGKIANLVFQTVV
jgi:hypothetical protein